MIDRRLATALCVSVSFAAAACGNSKGARAASSAEADSAGAFHSLAEGAPVPAYTISTLDGTPLKIGGEGAITVLNVWATWCTSCREEMADLNALQREFVTKGVRVVGVSVDAGDVTRVARFAEAERLAFSVAHDPEQRIQQLYQVVGVPETFIIDRRGALLWRHVGNLHPVADSVRRILVGAVAGT